MKILHVIDTLARGGAEWLLVMLLPTLERQGHRVCVAVRNALYDLQHNPDAAGVPMIRLQKSKNCNSVFGRLALFRSSFPVSVAEELSALCSILRGNLPVPGKRLSLF